VDRARLWLTAAAIAAYLPVLAAPLKGWWDFAAFWAGGKLAGAPQLLDLRTGLELQVAQGLPPTPFVYPPGVALLYVPFTWLPYPLAGLLHALLMLTALVAAARIWAPLLGIPRRWAVLGALAWGPAAASVISGQNAALVLLLAGLVARSLDAGTGNALLTGMAAGLAAYKPQLGWPVSAAALLRGRSRALLLAGVVAAGALQYLAGVVATGGDWSWPSAWLAAVRTYSGPDLEANGWQAISAPSIGIRLGHLWSSDVAVVVGWVVGIGLAVAALRVAWRARPAAAVALALAIGVLVDPHAWVYDATVLLPALGLAGVAAARAGWPRRAVVPLVLAFAAGSGWAFGGFAGITALPLVVAWLPFAGARTGE
jgi:hypothetical protein